MATTEHPTLDDIRQEMKNRLLDISDQTRTLETERQRLRRAFDIMSGTARKPGRPPGRPPQKRGPGRPPKSYTTK